MLNKLPDQRGSCHMESEFEAPGGCALNTAVALGAAGLSVALGGNFIGDDVRGEAIVAFLEEQGVLPVLRKHASSPTPFCQVLVDGARGTRDFILDHRGIQQSAPELFAPFLPKLRTNGFRAVFFQPYLRQIMRDFLDALFPGVERLARYDFTRPARPLFLSQDLGPDSPYLPHVDGVQISLDDDEGGTHHASVEVAAKPYFERHPNLSFLLVTRGARGASLVGADGSVHSVPAAPVARVVDTTGCGDTFRAGFMAGVARDFDLGRSLTLGAAMGAEKARHRGSNLTRASLRESGISFEA